MKKQVTLTALALATAFTANSAFAGVTVGEKNGGKLELSGKAFLGFQQIDNGGTKTIGGSVDRFYFQAKYKKDDWYARITTDVNNESSHVPAMKRKMNVFLKYAYVERKYSDAAQLRLGLSHTPWIDYEQHLWGHRYVSKVTTDYFGLDSSADYGIGLKGKVADKMVHYWITLTNGGGYGSPDRSGALDLNSRITVQPMKGLDISLQYKSGYHHKKSDSTVDIADKEGLTQLMVAYKGEGFTVGANSVKVTNFKTSNGADHTATSVWATGKFGGDMGAFARMDKDDDESGASTVTTNHQVVGVDFFIDKGFTMTAAFDKKSKDGSDDVKTMGLYSLVKF